MSIVETATIEEPQRDTPKLWADFTAACSEQDYYQGWLALQSGLIPGVVQGLLIVAAADKQFMPVAGWPQSGSDPQRLSDVVERVLEENCGLLVELPDSANYAIAYPLLVDETLCGVVALEVSASAEAELQRAMEHLQWGVAWLELLVRRKQADEDQATLHRLKTAVDMLAVVLGQESFAAAAMAFTTELSAASECERVSLGFLRGRKLKLQAVSHSAEVGRKMNLTRAIERVMEEAILQRREISYPPIEEEVLICREHEALSRQQSMASIISFPLYGQGRYYGALTCERAADRPFTERDVEFFRAIAALLGPALESKYLNDQPLPVKFKAAAQQQLQRLFGPRYFGRKLFLLLLIGVIACFSVLEWDYRLSADMTLEGAIRRAVVVPFNGFIDQAPARAGDLVEQGALLCSLDDRDLRLEMLAKNSQQRQLDRQYQEAVAKHDRAQAKIIKAQLDQSQAELDLIVAKLERSRLTAPFAGLLVSGDLSQRLGSAVEQGEILFEVTPLDAYRVILKVDERRIADVQTGQQGTLVLSSLPNQRYQFAVSKITPITTAEEGRNYFRIEAHLQTVDDNLRPGMEGVGKIFIDRRKLISIWTRDLLEWVQLTLWNWLP
ncbi:MAG: HlyD family efflux transporter periplasmic adaptor subunit [Desulfuromonadales bacterium]|nr:HlyD family efflux transporter periplasmic adaptor subunit [Desulfuromonadales bacterium]